MAELTENELTENEVTENELTENERALRCRIAELEALVESRTQTIVGLGARIAELQGGAPPSTAQRLRDTEAQLVALQATKVIRYSQIPRRWYSRLLGRGHG